MESKNQNSNKNYQVEHLSKLAKQLHNSLVVPLKIERVMNKIRNGEPLTKEDPYAFWYNGKIIYPYIEVHAQ